MPTSLRPAWELSCAYDFVDRTCLATGNQRVDTALEELGERGRGELAQHSQQCLHGLGGHGVKVRVCGN